MHRPMKILFLAWNYPPAVGGIEAVACNLRSGLVKLGHEVMTIARHSGEGSVAPNIVRPGSPGFFRYTAFAVSSGLKYLKGHPVDLVVCSGIASAPAALLMKFLKGVPYMVLAHGSDASRTGVIYKAAMSRLFRRAAAIAANSKNTKKILEECGCKPDLIRVIHPGVNELDFPEENERSIEKMREKHGLSGKTVMLSAGRLIRRKGILEFVRNVMPSLSRRCPDLIYLIAGGDATASLAHSERILDRLKQLVSDLDLAAFVKVLGSVTDKELKELYYCSDIFVLPAIPVEGDVEGFGIVFLEAALAGTPAVASCIGGIPEAVDDESGVLLAPEDWGGYEETVAGLLGDPVKLRSLGESARKRALQKFTWSRISEQYADFISSTVERMR